MEKFIKVSDKADTNEKKRDYAVRCIEKLHLEHNRRGALVVKQQVVPASEGEPAFASAGGEVAPVVSMSDVVGATDDGISLAEFRKWQKEVFEPLNQEAHAILNIACEGIGYVKDPETGDMLKMSHETELAAKESTTWDADIDVDSVVKSKEESLKAK